MRRFGHVIESSCHYDKDGVEHGKIVKGNFGVHVTVVVMRLSNFKEKSYCDGPFQEYEFGEISLPVKKAKVMSPPEKQV